MVPLQAQTYRTNKLDLSYSSHSLKKENISFYIKQYKGISSKVLKTLLHTPDQLSELHWRQSHVISAAYEGDLKEYIFYREMLKDTDQGAITPSMDYLTALMLRDKNPGKLLERPLCRTQGDFLLDGERLDVTTWKKFFSPDKTKVREALDDTVLRLSSKNCKLVISGEHQPYSKIPPLREFIRNERLNIDVVHPAESPTLNAPNCETDYTRDLEAKARYMLNVVQSEGEDLSKLESSRGPEHCIHPVDYLRSNELVNKKMGPLKKEEFEDPYLD